MVYFRNLGTTFLIMFLFFKFIVLSSVNFSVLLSVFHRIAYNGLRIPNIANNTKPN